MEYKRASEILPNELIETIQQYAEGCIIYIPNRFGSRKNWGNSTDTKSLLVSRNNNMKCDHQSGLSIIQLAIKYHLSESTVKKIIYCK